MPIILEHKGLNIPINNLKYNQSTQCRYNNIHNKIKLFQQVLFFFFAHFSTLWRILHFFIFFKSIYNSYPQLVYQYK